MIRKISFLFSLNLIVTLLFAQVYNPVEWSFTQKKAGTDFVDLIFKAKIEQGWHMYSQHQPSDKVPVIPTSFHFDEIPAAYQLMDELKEPKPITKYDKVNEMETSFFEGEAVFKQRIMVKSPAQFKLTGYLEYMVCDDSKCLPPETVDFEFKVNGVPVKENNDAGDEEKDDADSEPQSSINEESSQPSIGGGNAGGILDPVDWKFKSEKIDENEYYIILTADIEDGWHVYSQHLENEDGPVATAFNFDFPDNVEPVGDVVEGEPITEYDENFMMELSYFKGKAEFRQKVRITGGEGAVVPGNLEFMVCDDKRCLPPEYIDFEVKLGDGAQVAPAESGSSGSSQKESKMTNWEIFLIAFAAGLAAIFTPCVFPMIPLTVSFFTKQNKNKVKGRLNAITYGLFIVLIYLAVSLPFHLFDSADSSIFNEISTNVYVNLFFFLVFLVFAFSFLGAFELTLPNSWINKADKASNVGGIIGVFFMALTLVLVSFTCTGPIVGGLLGATFSGGDPDAAMQLSIGMLGFGLAFGLPFSLFAFFPSMLNALPKSGGWLNAVKVTFGLLELAFAFKFLSNADLVMQAGILKREVFIAIWIAVFFTLSLYLFGIIRFSHDSKMESLSVTRSLFAMLALTFTIYLIPGIWGAPLKLISGFPPPMHYSESPKGIGKAADVGSFGSGAAGADIPDGAHPDECPHSLNCFKDYDKGLAYARKVNKPVLIDFTGWACVNCRRMEEMVWSDPRVLKRLRDEVVLISLYVDERKKLPESEQRTVKMGDDEKKLRTVGNKWSYFQVSRYGANSQPFYVLIDHNEEKLNEPTAYNTDIQHYIDWLDEGIEAFEEAEE